jgi:hypothetical protein
MKTNTLTVYVRVFAASILLAGTVRAGEIWERIDVPIGQYDVSVGNEFRTVYPGCALGEPYSFHLKNGKNDKLLVYFNGGGACWDSNTCVGSLYSQDPVYVPSVEVANDPSVMGGILDAENPDNPYADWSMLFVSYCTGDVHGGSDVTTYEFPPGSGNDFPINHRGFDNFLFAMGWLKYNYPEIEPGKILVAGSSAGSYGAALNYPWVREFYQDADKVFLVGDGGVGVLQGTYEFPNAVFSESSVWNIDDTLHPLLVSVSEVAVDVPELFVPEVYNRLRAGYPKDKFAQYTTAYDAVQILFWDIMLNANDPGVWGFGLANPGFISEWSVNMRLLDGGLQNADLPDNYRSYIGAGCNHTIFRFDDDFYTSSLSSSSGEDVSFIQWLVGMTGGKQGDKADWQSLSCMPGFNCGEQNLTAIGINACLSRTFRD